jgi:hypothetical protein
VKRAIVMALSVILALALAMPASLAQVGQGAKASGKAAELAALWWQWALVDPPATNPLVGGYEGGPQCDGEPLSDAPGKKWFLAGAFGSGEVERTCTMPVGTQLFFPVGNVIFVITEPNENEQVAREAVNEFIDAVLADPEFSMSVTVDGKEVKSTRIVRAETALFTVTVPEDNIFDSPGFDLPAGSYEAVADGLWVALPPLPPGEHIVHFEMSAPSLEFSQDITYTLVVVKGNQAP